MDYRAFGQQLRDHRERWKFTQARVASLAGLSTSYYGCLERGTSKASIETLLALAYVLETTPDALLSFGSDYADDVPAPVSASIDAMRFQLDQIEVYYGTKNSRKKRARAFTGE